ncbi:MAG: biopolymer transporter Tol, partial [Planctomycetia bacterium]|nr:biopolymer transporter Tol [Planctomycetia bacterium]
PTAALYDVMTKRVTLLASDERSRRDWISLLASAARRLLRVSLPPAVVSGRALERPTILPVPGEIPSNQQEAVPLLQRLGRLGRPLCDSTPRPEGAEPARDRFLKEARLFFDALREDYPAALTSLEALEAQTSSSQTRERLLGVRAQLFLGMGDTDRAARTIEFLKSIEDHGVSRFDESPAGPTLTPERGASHGWARYLAARLDVQTVSGAGGLGGGDAPNGPVPPEAPLVPFPRFPFDRLPNGGFIVPRNGPVPAPDDRPRMGRPRPAVPPPPALPPVPF